MYRYAVSLIFALALAGSAIPAQAQQARRVWTNADMEELRARGLISIVGPETVVVTAAMPVAPAAQFPVYATRTEDPAWYAEQAADLQAQLGTRATALAQAQDNLLQARNGRGVTGSFDMAAGDTYGVTPEERIAFLASQVQETRARLNELADLARRNEIPAGVLRTAAA